MGLGRPLSVSFCLFVLALTGCSSVPGNKHSIPVPSSRYSGSVHGGQQPVAGASIQLYTVGTTADGSPATPLLTQTVTSDATGSFTITNLYSCTNATQVYLVATGGNPGLSTNNPNIALMAALGPCSALTASTFINIDELTTVAAVSALAPYMTSVSAIGSSSSDASSLAAAFTLANQLVNTATGTAPGTNLPVGATVPVTQLNTLADILSACINSTGGTAGDGSLCGKLFSLTTITPNPAPTDTISAMLNIAYNPTLNTSAIFALTPPDPPFQPTLTSAPADFLVNLQGASSFALSSSLVNFPPTINGTSSAPLAVSLSNSGSSTITVSAVTINGVASNNFAQTNNCSSVAVNASCTIYITFTPTATGTPSAILEVTSTASGSNTVSLNGSRVPLGSSPTLWPSSLAFTIWGANEDLIFTTGVSSATSLMTGTTGGSGTDHTYIETNYCGSSVAAGTSCSFSIANIPNDPLSTYTSGFPNVTGDAWIHGTSLTTDILSENSAYLTQGGSINGTSGTITFPLQRVGGSETATIQLANIGSGSPAASLAIGGANPGDFTVSAVQPTVSSTQSSFCPAASSGTQPCTITVTFTPTAAGTRSAKISLDANGSSTGQYIFVTGTGQ